MTAIYISIGNSDDKLSQAEWAEFVADVNRSVSAYARERHGKWMSLPHSPWQNACWCIEISADAALHLRAALAQLATKYRQESIAWAVAETEFINGA